MLRRIVIEGWLFGPPQNGDMPDYYRRHPQGERTVTWLIGRFERLAQTGLKYPLGGASAATLRRDITAILKERRAQGKMM